MKQRPSFRKPAPSASANNPEEFFYTLSGRAKSHAYLRGPQQDVLRDYIEVKDLADVAFELPTGSGKTTVALLIAEWHRRRTNGRAAFLTLTNQLAAQVIEEAARISIQVADLRGNKDRRSKTEEARFFDASAVAVSTYSNLFNVKPIIDQCDVLILDDAHGGGEFAASMWTLRIDHKSNSEMYDSLLATLSPSMTESQRISLTDTLSPNQVELIDLGGQAAVREQLFSLLDDIPPNSNLRFPWSLLRPHFHACHVFFSKLAVTIRPYIAPTFDHPPFSEVNRRIYLSATLGDTEDIKRAYAVEKIETVRAAQNQDGRRFVFIPALSMEEDGVRNALATIWPNLQPQRAVVITPSFATLERTVDELRIALASFGCSVFQARDIEESLEPFTGATNALLTLANRYDGLDLPDDDCRLLLLSESPRATNDLEANLSSNWKLGPALRWREATRLIQGMGRCTRNATDFSIIILLGESLVSAVTSNALLKLLPAALQAEILWGKTQLRDSEMDPVSFAAMVCDLVADESYRKEADQSIIEHAMQTSAVALPPSIGVAALEVAHAKAVWSGDFTRANEVGRRIADKLSGDEWAGYRAWWLYLSAIAAREAENPGAEEDALRRAKGTGVNAGWIDYLLRRRRKISGMNVESIDDLSATISERIWTALDELGWSGRRFFTFTNKMLSDVANVANHKLFHEGLVSLGKLLGAQANSPGQQGDPDVIWRFGENTWVCFEAKAGKKEDARGIAKKDLLQAKGHVDWVKFFKGQGKSDTEIVAVIIAPTDKLQSFADPHRENIYFLSTENVADWAKRTLTAMLEVRASFAGQEFTEARGKFTQELTRLAINYQSTLANIKAQSLS